MSDKITKRQQAVLDVIEQCIREKGATGPHCARGVSSAWLVLPFYRACAFEGA